MNSVWELLDHPFARQVGLILLNSVWQGFAIGLAFALVRKGLEGHPARTRYFAGCIALCLMAVVPLATGLLTRIPDQNELLPTASGSFLGMSSGINTNWETTQHFAGSGLENFFDRLNTFFASFAPFLTIVWLGGVVVFSGRLISGWWSVQVLKRSEHEDVEPEWMGILNDLRCRLEISLPVRLVKSAMVEVPTVVGWLRPIILLPASCLTGLSNWELEAILAHELAHVKRWDYLANAVQCFVETLMFFHPVTWWISSYVREEREHCCDDLVVEIFGDKLAYARALASLEQFRGSPGTLAFAASGGSLLKRIRRLAGVSEQEGRMNACQISGVALAGLGLGLILIGTYLNFAPARYRAIVRIKLENESAPLMGDSVRTGRYDPYFLQTQIAVLQSSPILERVSDRLDLATNLGKDQKRLSRQEIIMRLLHMLSFQPIRNTTLLQVACTSRVPEESARIANALAEEFRSNRIEQGRMANTRGLKVLEANLQVQRAIIRDAESDVDKWRQKLKAVDPTALTQMEGSVVDGSALSASAKLSLEIIESQCQLIREETMLNGLNQLSHSDLSAALSTTVPDPIVLSLLEQLTMAEQTRITLSKDFGTNHPKLVNLDLQIKELRSKLDSRAGGVLIALNQRVEAMRKSLGIMKIERDNVAKRDAELTEESKPYFEARRRLEDERRVGESLAAKIASASIEARFGQQPVVEIIDSAIPPARPVSPNRPMAMAIFLLGIGCEFMGLRCLRSSNSAALPMV